VLRARCPATPVERRNCRSTSEVTNTMPRMTKVTMTMAELASDEISTGPRQIRCHAGGGEDDRCHPGVGASRGIAKPRTTAIESLSSQLRLSSRE